MEINMAVWTGTLFTRKIKKECCSWCENFQIPQQTSIIKVPVALALYQNVRYTIGEKSIQQSPHQWDKTGIQFQFKQPYWFPYKELSSRHHKSYEIPLRFLSAVSYLFNIHLVYRVLGKNQYGTKIVYNDLTDWVKGFRVRSL
jgi:hypothetical protein